MDIEVQTKQTRIAQVRIVPRSGFYVVELVGIAVVVTNESHTSTCSFLDNEPVGHRERYVSKRVARGVFRTADGRNINADVNGAYNIIRKAIPNAFGNGIGDVVVHPVGMNPAN